MILATIQISSGAAYADNLTPPDRSCIPIYALQFTYLGAQVGHDVPQLSDGYRAIAIPMTQKCVGGVCWQSSERAERFLITYYTHAHAPC